MGLSPYPTVAEQFVDECAAHRTLRLLDEHIPPRLELDAIKARHFIGASGGGTDDDGDLNRIIFADASAAKLNRRGRWVVN